MQQKEGGTSVQSWRGGGGFSPLSPPDPTMASYVLCLHESVKSTAQGLTCVHTSSGDVVDRGCEEMEGLHMEWVYMSVGNMRGRQRV